MTRTDGKRLFYEGEVNVVFGDPEHGKTWVMLAACAEQLEAGGRVLVMDLDHNGQLAILNRLLMLGAPREVLSDLDRFRLCEPSEPAEISRVISDSQEWLPNVVMLDSTGELLPLFGASSDSADDFTKVHNQVLQPLADTGAAVLLADHLAKNRESRSVGPGGSMAKRRTVGGLSLRVVRLCEFVPGRGGSARLWVNKDRHGGVRVVCPPPDPRQKEQLAGIFVLEPPGADGVPGWQVTPDDMGQVQEFRPTGLMERVSRTVEDSPEPMTKTDAVKQTTGKRQNVMQGFDILAKEKYLTATDESARPVTYISSKQYRAHDDPASRTRGTLLLQHLPDEDEEGDDDDPSS